MAIATYTDSNFSPLFKRVWGEYGSNLYGTGAEDPAFSQVKKTFNFKGSQMDFPLDLSFGGGVGNGSLPEANTSKKVTVVLTRKKSYARMKLDRETMIASRGREGAFQDATRYETEAKLRSFMRLMACWFYNDGSGILGQFSGSASGTAAAPVVTALNTGSYTFRQAFFEEGDYINVVTAALTVLPSMWEITAVNTTTRAITLALVSGSSDLTAVGAGTHSIVMQGSYNACQMGIKGAVEASSTLYGIAIQRRYQAQTLAAAGQPIAVDHLNRLAVSGNNLTGKYFTHFIGSARQYEKLLNRQGDARRYVDVLSSTNKMAPKIKMSFRGLALDTTAGEIPFLPSRYVEDDRIYAINTDYIEMKHAEKFGWFEEDGSLLQRLPSDDAYEARYGGYSETWINPFYQAYISGLSTT